MKLLFDNAIFRYKPYPIGIAKPIFDEASYAALVESFPSDDLLLKFPFTSKEGGYKKYALNERYGDYYAYIESHPLWYAFYLSIKKPEFAQFILAKLRSQGIVVQPSTSWSTRFEFAGMPADGGYIAPHTDVPSKAVTLIFSMQKPGEWNPAWGGGTDVLRPLHPDQPLESYKVPLDQFEKVSSYPYEPNQCVIFVKNDVSWHSVGPMTGPPGSMRHTLTLNIERYQHLVGKDAA